MIKRPVELVHGAGPEGVADLGAVKSYAYGGEIGSDPAVAVARYSAVIGDVGELETFHLAPLPRIKDVRDLRGQARGSGDIRAAGDI